MWRAIGTTIAAAISPRRYSLVTNSAATTISAISPAKVSMRVRSKPWPGSDPPATCGAILPDPRTVHVPAELVVAGGGVRGTPRGTVLADEVVGDRLVVRGGGEELGRHGCGKPD